MSLGAADFINKPFEEDLLELVIERVLEQRNLGTERRELRGTGRRRSQGRGLGERGDAGHTRSSRPDLRHGCHRVGPGREWGRQGSRGSLDSYAFDSSGWPFC